MASDEGKVMVKGTIIDPAALVVKNKGRPMMRRLAAKSTFAPPKENVFLKVYKAKQLFKEARIACNRLHPDWIAIACFGKANEISVIGAADNTGRIHFGAIQQLIPDNRDRLSLPSVLIEMPKKCVKTTATKKRVVAMAIKTGGTTKDTVERMITRSKSNIGVEKIKVASAVGSGKQTTSEGKITKSERKIVSYLTNTTTKKKTTTRRKKNIGNKDVIPKQFNLEETRKETITTRKIKTVSYLADKPAKKKTARGRKRKIVLDANTSRNSKGLGKTYLAKKRISNGKKVSFTTKSAIKEKSDTNGKKVFTTKSAIKGISDTNENNIRSVARYCTRSRSTIPLIVIADDNEDVNALNDVKADDNEDVNALNDVKADDNEDVNALNDVKADDNEDVNALNDVKADDNEDVNAPNDVEADDNEVVNAPNDVEDDNEDVNALNDVKESVPQDFPNLNSRKSNPSDGNLDFQENKGLFPDMSCSSSCQPAKEKMLAKTSRKRRPVLQDKKLPRTFKPLKIGLPKNDQHGIVYCPYQRRFLSRKPSNKSSCLPTSMESQEQKVFPHKKKPLRLGLPKEDLPEKNKLPHGNKKICRKPLTRRLSLLPLKKSQEKEKVFTLKKKRSKRGRPKKNRQEKEDLKPDDSNFNDRKSLFQSRNSDIDLDNPESPFSGSNDESISDAVTLEKNSSSKNTSWDRPSTSKSLDLPDSKESEKNENVQSADSEKIPSSSTSRDRIGFVATNESQKKEDHLNNNTSGLPAVSSMHRRNIDLDNHVSPSSTFSNDYNSRELTIDDAPSTGWGAEQSKNYVLKYWELPSTSHETIDLAESGEGKSQEIEDFESIHSDTVYIENNAAYYPEGFLESWTESAEDKEKREKERYNQDVIDRFMESIANMKFG